MTSLFTARARAEEFAAAADGGAKRTGTHSAEVAVLVGIVTVLRSHQDTAPRPEFVGDLRERLMTEAGTVLTAENASLRLPARSRGTRERRLVAAASAVVLLGGTAGMAAAAQNALPGEALYPIKRVIERAEAGLSLSPAGKGADLLHQATDRLDEVQGLIAADSPQTTPQVSETLDDFVAQANEGSDLLLSSFEETRDPDSVVEVRNFAAEGITILEALAAELPAEAQDELTAAARTLRDIDVAAAALCSTCASGLPELEIPNLILARNEVDRALDTVSAGTLDNSHPVVVQKGAVTKPRTRKADTQGGRQHGIGRQGSGSSDPRAPGLAPAPTGDATSVPSPNIVDPKTWPTPKVEGQVSGGAGSTDAPKVVEDLTDGLEDGLGEVLGDEQADESSDDGLTDDLGGAVETLLPDTGVDQLLP